MLFNLINLIEKTIININAKLSQKFKNIKCIKYFLIAAINISMMIIIMNHAKNFLFLNFRYTQTIFVVNDVIKKIVKNFKVDINIILSRE